MPESNVSCSMGDDSAQGSAVLMVAVLSVLSPKPPTADSTQVSLVHSALPFPAPRVNGSKRNFLCWPFNRLSASPAISPWPIEPLLLFTTGCYLGSFWLWCYRLGSPAWGLDPTLLRGKHLATEISLQHFSCRPWEPRQLSHASSALPTNHIVLKCFLLSVHGYKASLQLVFSWLFKMISLQFSSNSRLVLGG